MGRNRIIAISRQYGSAGSTIGQRLAKELDIPYYDKHFVDQAVTDSGLSAYFMEMEEQKFISSLLFSLATGGYRHADNKEMADQVYLAECNAIREVAQQGPCVIVGRCADHILKYEQDVFSVFIHAPLPLRVRRAIDEYGLDPHRAEQAVRDKDRTRARHYEYYTDNAWGHPDHYHLSVNSGAFGIDGTVDILLHAWQMPAGGKANG